VLSDTTGEVLPVADTQSIHLHLSGVLAPVRSEDDFELKVVGRIPDALGGEAAAVLKLPRRVPAGFPGNSSWPE
jgi:hypothetical protein